MKQDYTMYIYKRDARCKAGERLFSTTVWSGRTADGMQREGQALCASLYPANGGWRFEYHPTRITVKSLMSGEDVQIDRDTPWSCNPASETFWCT